MSKMSRSGWDLGWLGRALAAAATVALLAGCVAVESQQAATIAAPTSAAEAGAGQQAAAPAGPVLGSQRQGDLTAWLMSKPAQPQRGTAEMDAYLAGADGKPVTDAQVTFDIDMTNMSHGLNQVQADPAEAGHYVGQVRFMMPGPWRVIAIVDRPGQETARLRFDFMVKR
ncbi:MAG: FixH family protein [Nitrososphaerales archaeon]